MRTIQIGIEVHKAIEAERQTLDEPENEILIRLLGLKKASPEFRPEPEPEKASWLKDGVELPHGTLLRVVYSGQEVEGVVDDGRWIVNGQSYASPSMALIENVTTKSGDRTNLNGWNHWTVKRRSDPGFVRLSNLRAVSRQT